MTRCELLRPGMSLTVRSWPRRRYILGGLGLLGLLFLPEDTGDQGKTRSVAVSPAVQTTAETLPATIAYEARNALVIGNAQYDSSIGLLSNPENDARAIAAMLERFGFVVDLRLNLTRSDMMLAILDFGHTLRRGGVGLFYYAGHAVQVDGRNFMIPIGTNLGSFAGASRDAAQYTELESVDLDHVLSRMGIAENRLNIVILDACRDNPFAGGSRGLTRGLAQASAPRGTMLAFAAAPGEVALDGPRGGNSVYTAALLDALEKPGLQIEDVFKRAREQVLVETLGEQTPWENSSLVGEFYFDPGAIQDQSGTAVAGTAETSAGPPSGDLGRRADQVTPRRPTEWLNLMGAPASRGIDATVWGTIQHSLNPADFELFASTYPDSPFAPFARNRLAALRPGATGTIPPPPTRAPEVEDSTPDLATTTELPPPPLPSPQPADPEPLSIESSELQLGLSRTDRIAVQRALTERGVFNLPIDGIFGPRTRHAIARWQYDAGFEPTGHLQAQQLEPLLGIEAQVSTVPKRRLKNQPVDARLSPGSVFRDCAPCPDMVVLPAGSFEPAAADRGQGSPPSPAPVEIAVPFAIGRYEVTFDQWDACVSAGGCAGWRPDDKGWGRGRRPVIQVAHADAQAYVDWLSAETGHTYRLPSEAEWEYAARAGAGSAFWWGNDISPSDANYGSTQMGETLPVGAYAPSPWQLFDVSGNVAEWVEDCWTDTYGQSRRDGQAWGSAGDSCEHGVVRGGSWHSAPQQLRTAARKPMQRALRLDDVGFRVARTLGP